MRVSIQPSPRSKIRRPCRAARLPARLALVAFAVTTTASAAFASFDHGTWNEILQTHVDDAGRVAYRDLAERDRAKLDAYLDRLAAADPSGFSQTEQLAFWINAYNAMAVAGILDGHQAESVFGRYRFFKSYERRIAGEERTLDEIEHEIIRPRFGDFRAHFAVNCASTSCPVLRNEAYVADRLDAQLDEQGRRFLADESRNRIDVTAGRVELSRIFEWFAEDFTSGGKTLAETLAPFLSDEQEALLRKADVSYLDYDWTMNAQRNQRP